MTEIFSIMWRFLNIPITLEGYTFKIWHPMAFAFIVTAIWNVVVQKGGEKA